MNKEDRVSTQAPPRPIWERERHLQQRVAELEAEIAALRESETWRVGTAIVRPVSRITRRSRRHDTASAAAPRGNRPFEVTFRDTPAAFRQAVAASRRVAIIGGFGTAPSGRLFGYQAAQVADLARDGWVVVLVNAADHPGALTSHARDIPGLECLIKRPNIGYDFGSWSAGYRLLLEQTSQVDEVLLVNDSVLGSPARVASLRTTKNRQFVCATDSYEFTHHAQSYLTLFGRDPIHSGALGQFLSEVENVPGRAEAVAQGELRLTGFMRDAGYDLKAAAPYEEAATAWMKALPATIKGLEDIYERFGAAGAASLRTHLDRLGATADLVANNTPMNPSHFFWQPLLRDFDLAMVKKELLVKNPVGVGDLTLAWHTDLLSRITQPTHLKELATAGAGSLMLTFAGGTQ